MKKFFYTQELRLLVQLLVERVNEQIDQFFYPQSSEYVFIRHVFPSFHIKRIIIIAIMIALLDLKVDFFHLCRLLLLRQMSFFCEIRKIFRIEQRKKRRKEEEPSLKREKKEDNFIHIHRHLHLV